MRIGILGPLDVRDTAAAPVEVSGRRLRALLIRLALEAGRSVSADRLLDDLWDGAPPTGGAGALQALVSRLRGVAGKDLVEYGPAGYRLALDPGEIDAVAFERRVTAARAESTPERRAAGLCAALDLWRGPALADVADAEFAAATIARLQELRLAAFEDRVDAELDLGRPAGPLVPELEALAGAHPLRERLRGQYMRALYESGRQADALAVFEETRSALADRLGVDPSPELAETHLAILRHDRTPNGDAPADLIRDDTEPVPEAFTPSVRPRTTNLPAQLTSFVGREEESQRVGKLLRENRLVTLTGPGGAGKTRLACEAAAMLLDDQPDGAWFVPLAPVSDPNDLAQAVLSALGAPDMVFTPESRAVVRPQDRLADFLAGKRMVIVLDNCEHVIDAAARLVDRALAGAPGVRVLATSREALGITGEALCPVPSLPLPPEGANPVDALGFASVRLLTDRAAAVRPGFAIDDENVAQVIAICRALDGIPLAIELAAARLRSLTPAQVADRLGDRFRLLTGGSRAALPRHRTLRAVVDWSWELLDDAERAVLRRLSVFAGGATPDAATRICADDDPAGAVDRYEVIDVVAALIDKSLVIADGDAEVRYRLLETVRAYGAERLEEAGERDRVRSAHAAFFVELAERAEPELRRSNQMVWSERLAAERDNCSAAFRHVIDTRDVPTGLRLVASLVWFWVMRDMEIEAGSWSVSVFEIAGDQAPPGLEEQYAICMCSASLIAEMVSDPGPTPERLGSALQHMLTLVPEHPKHPALILAKPAASLFTGDFVNAEIGFRELGEHHDPWLRAICRVALGFLAMNAGDIDGAEAGLNKGLELFREIGDRWGMIAALGGTMQVAIARGRIDQAVRLGEEVHGYVGEGMSPEQGSRMLIELGVVRAAAGDLEGAHRDLERGTAHAERIGEYADAAYGLLWQGEMRRREGDLPGARALMERALEMVEPRSERADFRQVSATTFSRVGCLTEQEGDLEASARWHARALRDISHGGLIGNQTIATLVEGIAALAAARGDHERAAELLGTARNLHGYTDPMSYEVPRTTAAATAALGEEGFAAAYERGRSGTREDVLNLVP
ncbi:AAA family ATPase [Actinomadura barringtoniae]|uniref:AAA family ATPase n=1 Tax=Actinomadura barringtoniae TaxID=1427535 RepID=A0A939P9K6_9ACTN|nr:BTAD domain-containing putative transcriptional regulator [Actinomadura barringtoniae]MBO2445469.1 AAA family ATPase [Actinomadura barringtoniae]